VVGEGCIMRSFITCTSSSRNIIRLIKSRRMRRAGNISGRLEMHTIFWLGNLKGGIF
jgi:hypothetical protein